MTDLDRFQNFAVSNRAGHRLLVAFIVASLLAAPAMRAAIQYRRLKSFGYPDLVGANPSAPLIQGSDGALYGTTEGGGRDNLGTVFKVNKDGSGYSALYSFNSTAGDGQDPVGGLVEGSDGALYGTTALGGNTNAGTVFKLNKDGSGYLVLHSFSGLDGRLPVARLIEGSNGTLYGTSYQGGSNNVGTVFELNKDGTSYSTLHSFSSTEWDGRNPQGGLMEASDGALYGTTASGGKSSAGTVFKLNQDGSGYGTMLNFSAPSGVGQYPADPLLEGSDGALYGTTIYGGNANAGTVFKLNKDGSGYDLLHDFGISHSGDGLNPVGGLVEGSDGALYGTTYQGGGFGPGTVFKLNKDGSDYSILHSFSTADNDGRYPQYGLVEGSDGALYGTTYGGGSNNAGTLFKLNKDRTDYSVLRRFSLTGGDAWAPQAGLVEGSDGALYGTTSIGCSNNSGTVFKMNKDGSSYTVLRSFGSAGEDGRYPYAGLLEGSDGALYGTTYRGGSNNSGTVFKMNKDGTDYNVLHSFSLTGGDGWAPQAGLVEGSDRALYGTTYQGGSNNSGTVFKLNKDGTDYSVLHRFSLTGGDGWAPQAGLVEGSDRALYGTTYSGGSNNSGTVFKLNEDGTDYSVLRNFSGAGGDGRYPYAGLVEGNDGALYGTTYGGGSNNLGTVFKLNKDGSGYSVLYNFSITGGDGHNPQAALAMGRDGAFYGTTRNGGDLGFGTVFRLLVNSPPVAVARAFPLTTLSPDDTNGFVISLNNADATVYFDGSRSSDVENDPLRFFWFEDSSTSPFVTGVVATSVLPVGSHVIVLIVSDGMDTGTNRIVVEVVTAGQAVEKLIDIVNDSAVSHKDTHPLIVTLNAASASFNRGNPMAGLNQLATFQSKVLARVSPDDPALAQALSQAAQKIIDAFASLRDRPRSVHLERRNHF